MPARQNIIVFPIKLDDETLRDVEELAARFHTSANTIIRAAVIAAYIVEMRRLPKLV